MNKVCLVTGSAKGIGASIIRELAKSGIDCVINYLHSEKEAYLLEDEIKKYGVNTLVIKADVSNEEEVNEMFLKIEEKFNGIDILVNNASVDIPNIFDKKTINDFKKTLDVNVIGAYIVSKRAYQYMKNNKWGRIINISSTNALNTYYPMGLEYDASKAALISLTHNLAIQFAPFITVNAIAPGFIGTDAELDGYDEDFLKEEIDKILVKRVGKPEEVANLVKFLASDDSSYINNSIYILLFNWRFYLYYNIFIIFKIINKNNK